MNPTAPGPLVGLCLSSFALSPLFASTPASANEWRRIFDCNEGAVVVDEQCSAYRGLPCYVRRHQLVIRDAGVVTYFREKRADGTYFFNNGSPFWQYEGNELIVELQSSTDENFLGQHQVHLKVPFADDRYEVDYNVWSNGSQLTVEAVKTSSMHNDIAPEGKLAEWAFESCQAFERTPDF